MQKQIENRKQQLEKAIKDIRNQFDYPDKDIGYITHKIEFLEFIQEKITETQISINEIEFGSNILIDDGPEDNPMYEYEKGYLQALKDILKKI